MKAYRIGRKQGSWVNRTPPIRGGIFCKDAPDEKEIELSDSSVASDAEADETSSLDDAVSSASEACSTTGVDVKGADVKGAEGLKQRGAKIEENRKRTATLSVANAGVAREIQHDLETYPSPLDTQVQHDIARKYQVLHQKVHDMGLYNCPYIEYGKELARYTTLFSLFGLALYNEWYITSAMFLGMFWVCISVQCLKLSTNKRSIKSCLLPTTLAILPSHPTSLSTLLSECLLPISAVVFPSVGGRAVTTCTTL
jgi:delta8-fatty-acid desaturase